LTDLDIMLFQHWG